MDPTTPPSLFQRLTSRKFLVSIVGALLVAGAALLEIDLDPASVASFAALLVAFILGEAKIDSDAVKAGASKYVQALEAELQKVLQVNAMLASMSGVDASARTPEQPSDLPGSVEVFPTPEG